MAPTGLKPTEERSGFVYLITNPAWPGKTKIGSTNNLSRRLNSYNTGSPHRDYRLHWWLRCVDRVVAEASAHTVLTGFRIGRTEWFHIHPEDAQAILSTHLKEI